MVTTLRHSSAKTIDEVIIHCIFFLGVITQRHKAVSIPPLPPPLRPPTNLSFTWTLRQEFNQAKQILSKIHSKFYLCLVINI